jgi:hypothetical protein
VVVVSKYPRPCAGNVCISHVVQWLQVVGRAWEPHVREGELRPATAGLTGVRAPERGTEGDGIMGQAPNDVSKHGGYVNSPQAGEEPRPFNTDSQMVVEVGIPIKQEVKGTGMINGGRGASTGNKASGRG